MFQLQKSSFHNIAFSSENLILSESGEKYAQSKPVLQVKTIKNMSEQICRWILMLEDNYRWWTFSWTFILTAPIPRRGSIGKQGM